MIYNVCRVSVFFKGVHHMALQRVLLICLGIVPVFQQRLRNTYVHALRARLLSSL